MSGDLCTAKQTDRWTVPAGSRDKRIEPLVVTGLTTALNAVSCRSSEHFTVLVSLIMDRSRLTGTSVLASCAVAPLRNLVLSLGVKAPCRPCRG